MKEENIETVSDSFFVLSQLMGFSIHSKAKVFQSEKYFNNYVDEKLEQKGVKKTKANRTKEIKSMKGTIFIHNDKPFAYLVL